MSQRKIQKKIPITKEQFVQLKKIEAVEGRYPNIFISGKVAKAVGESVQHIRNRGLGSRYDMDSIYDLICKHSPVTRAEIDELLMSRLPEILSENQKKRRIHYYLAMLAKEGKIFNKGSRRLSKWFCSDNKDG